MSELYFITTIRLNNGDIDDQRPVGFFGSEQEAQLRIENDSCGIFECGYYQYAVIVKIKEGLYPDQQEIQWFEYSESTETIGKIDKPALKDSLNQDFRPYIIG